MEEEPERSEGGAKSSDYGREEERRSQGGRMETAASIISQSNVGMSL